MRQIDRVLEERPGVAGASIAKTWLSSGVRTRALQEFVEALDA
jgi:hypothetical protein